MRKAANGRAFAVDTRVCLECCLQHLFFWGGNAFYPNLKIHASRRIKS